MQYMLMCCFDEKAWEALPEPQKDKVKGEDGKFSRGCVKSGRYRAGGKLTPSSTAATVREKNGKSVTLDGPFAETKEQIGGYHLVEGKDLHEAPPIAPS